MQVYGGSQWLLPDGNCSLWKEIDKINSSSSLQNIQLTKAREELVLVTRSDFVWEFNMLTCFLMLNYIYFVKMKNENEKSLQTF